MMMESNQFAKVNLLMYKLLKKYNQWFAGKIILYNGEQKLRSEL